MLLYEVNKLLSGFVLNLFFILIIFIPKYLCFQFERNVYCTFFNAKTYHFHVFIFKSWKQKSIENESFQTIFFFRIINFSENILIFASNFVHRRTITENVTTVDLEVTFNTTSLSSLNLVPQPENDTDSELFYNLKVMSVSEPSISMYIVGQLYWCHVVNFDLLSGCNYKIYNMKKL